MAGVVTAEERGVPVPLPWGALPAHTPGDDGTPPPGEGRDMSGVA